MQMYCVLRPLLQPGQIYRRKFNDIPITRLKKIPIDVAVNSQKYTENPNHDQLANAH